MLCIVVTYIACGVVCKWSYPKSVVIGFGWAFGLGLDNFPLLLITAIWIFLSLICLTPTIFVRLTVANEKSVVAGGESKA